MWASGYGNIDSIVLDKPVYYIDDITKILCAIKRENGRPDYPAAADLAYSLSN